MGLGVCDRGFRSFTLSYKLWLSSFDLGLGRTLMKFETSIIAGPSSGFGVKPKSNVCCLYFNQEYSDEQ
jgi:hypothetical protein